MEVDKESRISYDYKKLRAKYKTALIIFQDMDIFETPISVLDDKIEKKTKELLKESSESDEEWVKSWLKEDYIL